MKDLSNKLKKATLAAGCFWCVEAIFKNLNGVVEVVSGYSGGKPDEANYESVKTGMTAHAEVCQITFDETVITFEKLLEVFFRVHNPTTLNQQGADIGPQYRSAIFYHNLEQHEISKNVIEALDKSGAFDNKIVTSLERFEDFIKAEDYHQNYFEQNENSNQYCTLVIRPKVEKFQKAFGELLKK